MITIFTNTPRNPYLVEDHHPTDDRQKNENKKNDFPQDEFRFLENMIREKFSQPIEVSITPENQRYLDTKAEKLGHLFAD